MLNKRASTSSCAQTCLRDLGHPVRSWNRARLPAIRWGTTSHADLALGGSRDCCLGRRRIRIRRTVGTGVAPQRTRGADGAASSEDAPSPLDASETVVARSPPSGGAPHLRPAVKPTAASRASLCTGSTVPRSTRPSRSKVALTAVAAAGTGRGGTPRTTSTEAVKHEHACLQRPGLSYTRLRWHSPESMCRGQSNHPAARLRR